MNDGMMSTYEQEKINLSNKYSKIVIIDNIYTRPYMPSEINSEVHFIDKKEESNQSRQTKTKIWNYLKL